MDKTYLNNLGAEASSAGDFGKAEKYFTQALELSPDDPLVCYNIGFVLLKKGEKEEALKWFDTAIENANNLASINGDSANGGSADAVPEENFSGKLALDCGLACFEASLYDSAEKYYGKAAASEDKKVEYWNRLGVLKFVTGLHEEAMGCFEKAVTFDAEHIDAWFNLADTYDVLGFADKALKAREKYQSLERDNQE